MNLYSPAPSAPPTSVSAPDATSSSITVQWRAVDCIHRNGNITGYSVRYEAEESGSGQNVFGNTTTIIEMSDTKVTIFGLMRATNYSIAVAAVNSAGTGVYSDSITAETDDSTSK